MIISICEDNIIYNFRNFRNCTDFCKSLTLFLWNKEKGELCPLKLVFGVVKYSWTQEDITSVLTLLFPKVIPQKLCTRLQPIGLVLTSSRMELGLLTVDESVEIIHIERICKGTLGIMDKPQKHYLDSLCIPSFSSKVWIQIKLP